MSKVFKKDGTDVVATAGICSREYESKALTIANGASDYNAAVTGGLFANLKTALYTEIRTNQTISVKINKATNDAIEVTSADGVYIIDWMQVENLFISNASGNPATVKIAIAG